MSADLFTQSNGAHLEQTGGQFADRFRMGFGAAQNDNSIRFRSETVHVSHSSVLGRTELVRFHRGSNRRSAALLVHAQAMENFSLPFRLWLRHGFPSPE